MCVHNRSPQWLSLVYAGWAAAALGSRPRLLPLTINYLINYLLNELIQELAYSLIHKFVLVMTRISYIVCCFFSLEDHIPFLENP